MRRQRVQPGRAAQRSHLTNEHYLQMYQQSVEAPDTFWAEHGKRLHWFTPFTTVKSTSFDPGKVSINWFADGVLNASYNCLDRHLPERADQVAFYWEGDSSEVQKTVTYAELHQQVCKLANGMKALGVKKGDRVTIYLPMIPEAAVAMLACARIGAAHSVVFGGFSSQSLSDRINDAEAKLLITADGGWRRGEVFPLKSQADEALKSTTTVEHVVVVKRGGNEVDMQAGRDHWYHELMATADAVCPPEPMDSEQLLFLLYTSGTTGKPKGIMHTSGGYLTQVLSHWDGYTRPCEIIAATRSRMLRESVAAFGRYSVRYGASAFDQTIDNVRMIDMDDDDAVISMYTTAEIIGLSLPEQAIRNQAKVIAKGLLQRFERRGRELTLLIVLNKVGGAAFVRRHVQARVGRCFDRAGRDLGLD